MPHGHQKINKENPGKLKKKLKENKLNYRDRLRGYTGGIYKI
jgi:hypothetical protein